MRSFREITNLNDFVNEISRIGVIAQLIRAPPLQGGGPGFESLLLHQEDFIMDFTFSFTWMGIGLLIAAAGGAVIYFYRQIAENLANGVSSYEHVKLFGVITVVVGLLVTANLHIFVLTLIVNLIRGGH